MTGFRVIQEYERAVIFRLGRLKGLRGPGLIYVIPMFERFEKMDLRIKVFEIPPQEVMSADNVPVHINAICYYQIVEPIKAILEVYNYHQAVFQLSQAITRTIIGESNLDELLSNREKLNNRIEELIENRVIAWGLHVHDVEIKDVELPDSMKRAMARQAEAERNKRGRIIKAEGEKAAAVILADAARSIENHPKALHLRTLQTIAEIGAEQNTTTIVTVPVEMLKAFEAVGKLAERSEKGS